MTLPDTAGNRVYLNPHHGPLEDVGRSARANDVHRKLPHYERTPLTDCPAIAEQLGLAKVWVKDESSRLGLPSFKILGASYATYRALAERLGGIEDAWTDIEQLRSILAPLRPMTLAAATDGNHGRAVARMAALLDFTARIYVPEGTSEARIAAIQEEGADVEVVHGDYDAAVHESAKTEGPHCLVVSDTSWPGYERIPGWVIDGYATIFEEVSETLAARHERQPTTVMVPIGVGALAAAAIRNHHRDGSQVPRIIGVEPENAACVIASLRAGRRITVPGPHSSIMAGLNCGTPSKIAWPHLYHGLDAVVAIDDDRARASMRILDEQDIVSGETGAAALGGLQEIVATTEPAARSQLSLGPDSHVLVLSTEGATDLHAYTEVVGHTPRTHKPLEE